jgi:hypothetical protein
LDAQLAHLKLALMMVLWSGGSSLVRTKGTTSNILPLFQNIRCFSFMNQMHLDIF